MESDHIRRATGLSGLAGALLFFAGDMLFYGHVGSGATFAQGMLASVTSASSGRLFAGGLVGPPAACLCIVGFWHVYLSVRKTAIGLGRLMVSAFAMLMVSGSAVHTLWAAKGLALKYCLGQGSACSDLTNAIKSYWALAYDLGAVPGYLGATLLLGLVLMGVTWYPRWTALANPAVLGLLSPAASMIPAPVGASVVGGFTNLSIAFFFLISVVTTWKRRDA